MVIEDNSQLSPDDFELLEELCNMNGSVKVKLALTKIEVQELYKIDSSLGTQIIKMLESYHEKSIVVGLLSGFLNSIFVKIWKKEFPGGRISEDVIFAIKATGRITSLDTLSGIIPSGPGAAISLLKIMTVNKEGTRISKFITRHTYDQIDYLHNRRNSGMHEKWDQWDDNQTLVIIDRCHKTAMSLIADLELSFFWKKWGNSKSFIEPFKDISGLYEMLINKAITDGTVSKILKAKRREKKLSVILVANQLNVGSSIIEDLEKGRGLKKTDRNLFESYCRFLELELRNISIESVNFYLKDHPQLRGYFTEMEVKSKELQKYLEESEK